MRNKALKSKVSVRDLVHDSKVVLVTGTVKWGALHPRAPHQGYWVTLALLIVLQQLMIKYIYNVSIIVY